MRRGTTLAVALVFIACGSPKPAAPTGPPAPAADSCAHVADHLLTLVTTAAKEAPADELDRVRANFNQRCNDGAWSADARKCFLSLKAKDEIDRCASLMTDSQRESANAGSAQ